MDFREAKEVVEEAAVAVVEVVVIKDEAVGAVEEVVEVTILLPGDLLGPKPTVQRSPHHITYVISTQEVETAETLHNAGMYTRRTC